MPNSLILGLGSSQGNRLDYLRQAIAKLNACEGIAVQQVAPVYVSDALLPDDAPLDWHTDYLNSAVACQTTLAPQELLKTVKRIETEIGRKPAERWAPRIIDIDILSYASQVICDDVLEIPHREITHRPFVLWPLLDLKPHWQHAEFDAVLTAWGDRFSGLAPFRTRQINQQLIGPELVGIVNLTPDSFSNDGLDGGYTQALAQAKQMFAEGAAILDIGAESTNPNSMAITPEQECQRLLPFLDALKTVWQPHEFQPLISIDTYHAETVEKVLAYKVDWINDVSTRELPAIAKLLKGSDKKYVFMHSLDVPVKRGKTLPDHCDPVQEVVMWGRQTLNKLLSLGMQRQQLIYDPGIGFGNSASQALEMLQRIAEFKQVNVSLYIGHSRKLFLNQFTTKPFDERDVETSLISSYLATQPVDYLRVHDVALNSQAIKIAHALTPIKVKKIEAVEHAAMAV